MAASITRVAETVGVTSGSKAEQAKNRDQDPRLCKVRFLRIAAVHHFNDKLRFRSDTPGDGINHKLRMPIKSKPTQSEHISAGFSCSLGVSPWVYPKWHFLPAGHWQTLMI
jgi:hypothetical protein